MLNKPTASPFKMRGDNMTRIETFVAAAFAFAVTMLVISVGSVPETMQDFVDATKQIPAFTASCALIMWIWHSHAVWCRRYGLEDGMTIFLSSGLIILVLTYIYPLRLMMQALFSSVSNGYFPMEMTINFVWELRFMFAFYAIGFLLLSINFVALYLYAHRKRNDLGLDEVECFDTQTEIYIWSIGTGIGAISLLFSLILPADFIGFSGYVLFALFPFLYGLGFYRTTKRASIVAKVV